MTKYPKNKIGHVLAKVKPRDQKNRGWTLFQSNKDHIHKFEI